MGNALESVGGAARGSVVSLSRVREALYGHGHNRRRVRETKKRKEREKRERKKEREREKKRKTDGKGKERARQAGQWPRSEQRGAACTGGSSRFVDLDRNARHNLP